MFRSVYRDAVCLDCDEPFSQEVQFETGPDDAREVYLLGVPTDVRPDTYKGIASQPCERCLRIRRFRNYRTAAAHVRVEDWIDLVVRADAEGRLSVEPARCVDCGEALEEMSEGTCCAMCKRGYQP